MDNQTLGTVVTLLILVAGVYILWNQDEPPGPSGWV